MVFDPQFWLAWGKSLDERDVDKFLEMLLDILTAYQPFLLNGRVTREQMHEMLENFKRPGAMA